MKAIILSHFNQTFGPRILLHAPKSLKESDFYSLPALMDLYNEGFFIHTFGNYKSANYIFNIFSKEARGMSETLLISIIFDINNTINYNLSKEILEGFAREFENIEDVYKAFHAERNQYEDAREKLERVKDLFYTLYNSIPEESIMYKYKDAKILLFGLTYAGKTTLINCLKDGMRKKTLPTTYIDVSRIVINNVSLITYDTPGQIKFRNLWKPFLKNQDGLVFVLDIADKEQYSAAREILHNVVDLPDMEGLPLLILFNKIDLEMANIEALKEDMKLNKFTNRPLQCYLTCGLTGENVNKAFQWISEKLSKIISPQPKSEFSLLFSKWDENEGAKIVANYPLDVFDDPEVIAIRCFSISQFIFGGQNFKRTSVILPFTHLKLKAAIYFDVISDDSIRGGALPLSLVIFYNEKIPRAIIERFNSFIFDKFTQIKELYMNKSQVLTELRKIYNTILEKLKSVEPTIQALRIAEMRYQALFMAARDAILIIDRKSGIIVDANKQAEEILQLPSDILIGMHSTQLKLEGEQVDFKQIIFKQIELGNPQLIEIKIENPSEISIPVEINASEIQMGGQNLIQCIIRDITERKIAENRLISSENKYRHLFTNSPFSIILIDSNGIVVDCNPMIKQLLGYSNEELIGKRYDKLPFIHPEYLKSILESLKRLVKGESITILDVQLKTKEGGLIWVNIQISVVIIDQEIYIQILANNITNQKEAKEALRESEYQFHKALDRANFYKELFAHDVDNIFKEIQSSITNYKQTQSFSKNSIELKFVLETIKDQCQSGIKLVSNVRKLSQLEDTPLSLVKMELVMMLQKAIKSISDIFQDKKIDIKIYPPNKQYYVNSNEILVDVFENILIHIIEYNENPNIDIQILIYRQFKEETNYLKIEFVDKVVGSSFGKNIKEKSYKDSRSMLLGLSFVDQIINSLNGEMWVTGSNFVVIIPENA
ncbi:MAG: PAS domain S-box protein [Candidatus Hermodarchaeota archaeon]